MKALVSTALSAAFVFSAAQAQDVPSGTYTLDSTHTTVVWAVSHGGFSMYRGTFDEVEGTLEWNANRPTRSKLSVSIDANSVDVPAAVSHAGNANFQEDVAKNALGADTQPVITFVSKKLKKKSDTTGVIEGELSFNGNTGPVTMDVTLIKAAESRGTPKMGFSGSTTIDRTQWGSDSWVQFGIGSEVTITIETEFAKAAE
ncbi:MAG: YceI family protein [Pseudomonadota bacterium]